MFKENHTISHPIIDNINLAELYQRGIHGIEHAYRVWNILKKICIAEKLDDQIATQLEFCAIFHDIGRINDDIDDIHGYRSIVKLNSNSFLGIPVFDNQFVRFIIENHCLSDNTGFNSVTKYTKVKTEEFKYCLKLFKDADNLDRVRLGDFNINFIRLESSRRTLLYAQKLFNTELKFSDINEELLSFVNRNVTI